MIFELRPLRSYKQLYRAKISIRIYLREEGESSGTGKSHEGSADLASGTGGDRSRRSDRGRGNRDRNDRDGGILGRGRDAGRTSRNDRVDRAVNTVASRRSGLRTRAGRLWREASDTGSSRARGGGTSGGVEVDRGSRDDSRLGGGNRDRDGLSRAGGDRRAAGGDGHNAGLIDDGSIRVGERGGNRTGKDSGESGNGGETHLEDLLGFGFSVKKGFCGKASL